MRRFRVQIRKVLSKLEQVVGEGHPLRNGRLIELSLFGLAPEIEVGQHAPLLERLKLLNDGVGDLVGDLQKPIAPSGGISEDHHEEHGRFSAPIVPKRRHDADHVRSQALSGSRYFCPKSGLLRKRRWHVHDSIIARRKQGAHCGISGPSLQVARS